MPRIPPTRRRDGLGPRRAMPDRLLPALVAAMTFLAGIAAAGAAGADALARRWEGGAASLVSVQVPSPAEGGTPAGAAVERLLAGENAFATVRRLDPAELRHLLGPWLGDAGDAAAAPVPIPLPTVFQLRLRPGETIPSDLGTRLRDLAPGTTVEGTGTWAVRLLALVRSLQLCAVVSLVVVGLVAAGVVAAATRAGLGTRRVAIEIVHELGASDSYIAGRFARRATRLAFTGGVSGTILALPLLLLLCRLAAPFAAPDPAAAPNVPLFPASLHDAAARIPAPLLFGLPLLPVAAALIGWGTAQLTVRTWLRRLP
ncbi:MAG: hypothetical protein INR65_00980 [Gluconacetobacter diazotrophicus]|nr:hypothetical protein [Gluconacetobacter diazotrophicus]